MAHILVIEDNRSLNTLLQELLKSRGHEVQHTADARDMEGIIQAGYDLVVTDIIMPHKSGVEVIKELRRLEKPPRILAISGGDAQLVQAQLETARIAGADIVLPKPFTNRQFLAAVEKLLPREQQ